MWPATPPCPPSPSSLSVQSFGRIASGKARGLAVWHTLTYAQMKARARVRNIARPWSALVRLVDPDYDREKRREVQYDFSDVGGRIQYGDPARTGVYAPED